MKKILILFVFIIATQVAYSQTYHKLIRDSVYWDEVKVNGSGNGCFGRDSIKRLFFESDTLIKGMQYSKVFYYNFISLHIDSFCPPYEISPIKYELNGVFVREDTIEKKVYIRNFGIDTLEHLIFDFSLQLGDSLSIDFEWCCNFFLVTSIDSVQLLNGEYRKRFNLLELQVGLETYIIEGIGSVHGLVHGIFMHLVYGYYTICVKEHDTPLFSPQFGDCDVYFTGTNVVAKSKLRVYPSIFNDYIRIENCEEECLVSIINIESKVVKEVLIDNAHTVVPTSNLPTGMYLIRVHNFKGDIVYVGKFIKL